MAAILISAALEPFLPRVSLPLVQILVGMLLYWLVELPADFSIESDLFLVLFISPLLFDESKSANMSELWSNKGSILSLAIGLVFVMTLVVGFALNLITPSVPLAAAFALGAALGPTDAVAVASLSKEVKLNTRQSSLLTGEALLNDASGVVAFQFAIAAAVTGAFSLADASATFLLEFCGGIAIGAVIAAAAYFLVRRLRKAGIESATFHVCYEIFLPLFSYIVASTLHMSGILAVVAAGLLFSWLPKLTVPRAGALNTVSARINIASGNVWSLISFVLNGVIFTYLGFRLPSTLEPAITETALSTPWLICIAVAVTAVTVIVRFIWIAACDLVSGDSTTDIARIGVGRFLRNALVTTLAGPKGAVSLSIAMTIPFTLSSGLAMPVRDFLLFLTCAVIILTLLLANFVVPVLSPNDDEEDDDVDAKTEIAIINNVIKQLREQRCDENKAATTAIIRNLNERKASLQRDIAPNRQLRFLRQEVLEKQEEYIREQKAQGNVDKRLAERYLKRIDRMATMLKRRGSDPTEKAMENLPLASSTMAMARIQEQVIDTKSDIYRRIEFKIGIEKVAVEYLEHVLEDGSDERKSAARALLSEHRPLLATLKIRLEGLEEAANQETIGEADIPLQRAEDGRLHVDRKSRKSFTAQVDDLRAEALRIELDEIQSMNEAGKISNATARAMREEIYLLQMALAND